MDELVKLVASKVGISEAQAKEAVETVLGFLKDKLPSPMADQLEAVLEGDLGDLGNLDDLGGVVGNLGGLFGKK